MSLPRRRLLRIGALGAFALSGSAAWVLVEQPAVEDDLPPPLRLVQSTKLPDFVVPGLPSFGPGFAGADIALAGRSVLLNIFASWCAPCAAEAPLLVALRALGLPIWGIAYKDKPDAIADFLRRFGDPYGRIGLDERGDAAGILSMSGVPENLLVDATGMIRWRWPAGLTVDLAEQELLPLWRSLA